MYVLYDRIVIDSHLSEEGSKLSHKIIYYIDLIKLILWALIILFDSYALSLPILNSELN